MSASPVPTIDPAAHQTLDALEAAYQAALPRPADSGEVTLMVARTADGRMLHAEAQLTREGGMPLDRWATGAAIPDQQLTVMDTAVASLLAAGQPLSLFGDNLFVTLDVSAANLPTGTRLQAGEAVLEVSPEPHDGCRKFLARFGKDALRFVARPATRFRNARGIYMRVVEAGVVRVGDPIVVLSRPA